LRADVLVFAAADPVFGGGACRVPGCARHARGSGLCQGHRWPPMRADNSAHVITAAKQRHELTRAKAVKAIRELAQTGEPVDFPTVAARAGVSRSWLYTQPDIKVEIQTIRTLAAPAGRAPVPVRQRSSDASLLRRLEIANNRIRELTEDNQRLRNQLAQALGANRAGPSHVALR
jgi:hypothetical protein